jgi:hypothetical protein
MSRTQERRYVHPFGQAEIASPGRLRVSWCGVQAEFYRSTATKLSSAIGNMPFRPDSNEGAGEQHRRKIAKISRPKNG